MPKCTLLDKTTCLCKDWVCMQRQMSGLNTEVGQHSGAWSEPDATSFMVRGSDYMKTRRKVNSDKAIYRYICSVTHTKLRGDPV